MPAADTLLELGAERRAFRTRSDKRHIAFNNVPELRDLVHAGLSHNFAEGRNARIVALSPSCTPRLRVDVHGAKLVHVEDTPALTYSPLSKNNRARRLGLDLQGDDAHRNSENNQRAAA